MFAPAKHLFSVEDYYRMAETGVLRPGARVELLEGEIIDMSPIGPFHGGITNRLLRLFTAVSQDQCVLTVQNPVRLDDHSEPQPDLMLLKPAADFYGKRHPRPEDVCLLVEVSDTTLALDVGKKLPAYGRAGIAEVWIVNLNDETIEVYREPHFAGYGSKTILGAGQHATPMAFPDVTVDVTDLFKR